MWSAMVQTAQLLMSTSGGVGVLAWAAALLGTNNTAFIDTTEEVPLNSGVEAADASSSSSVPLDAETTACNWWMPGDPIVERLACTHSTIGRLGVTVLTNTFDDARRCSKLADGGCVLTHELGLIVPGVYYYSPEKVDLVLAVAPRVINMTQDDALIRIFDPSGVRSAVTTTFFRNVAIEYTDMTRVQLDTKMLSGDAAYCVQLLRQSMSAECWNSMQQ